MKNAMMRPLTLLLWGILLAVAVSGCYRSSGVTAPSPPAATPAANDAFSYPGYNVLLVGFDALRPDHTSLYRKGRDTTPNLVEFSKTAYVFQRAYSAASWTLPSFMSVFTALYPTVNGVTNKWRSVGSSKMVETRLSPTVVTLPQILKKNGYSLAAFTGGAGVSAKYGYGRDFDHYLDDVRFAGMDHSIPDCMNWLQSNSSKPWFIFLHGYDVHGQYDPPGGYTRRYAKDYKGPLKGGKVEQAGFRERGLRVALQPGTLGEPHLDSMTAEDARFYADLYDEKINDADERFGKFMAWMKEQGHLDRTIVIVMSDHGEEFLDHGHLDHGHTLYKEQTHVVMMVHFPGQQTRHDIDDEVCLIDLLPTALDALGVPIGHKTNGVSLLPILKGQHLPRNKMYAETDYRLFVHKRSIQDANFKFVYNLVTKKRELFDRNKDPFEKVNLVARNPAVATAMEKDLMEWLRGMNTPIKSYEGLREDFVKEF